MIFIKQLLFFILLFTLYLLVSIVSTKLKLDTTTGKILLVLVCIVATLSMYGYATLTKLFVEKFELSSPGKYCQGGSYLFQGSDPRSVMCRELESSKAGREEIGRFNCGKGMIGYPVNHWEDTPMSDGSWKNEMCDKTNCPCPNCKKCPNCPNCDKENCPYCKDCPNCPKCCISVNCNINNNGIF